MNKSETKEVARIEAYRAAGLHPEPLNTSEPNPLTVILGAFAFAGAMYLLTFLAFCL